MAFLGLIPEFMAGAELLGTGVAELTGSEFIGSTVQGAAVGKAGEAVTSAATSLAGSAVNKIFGEGTTTKINEKVEKSKQLGNSFFDYVAGGSVGTTTSTYVDPISQVVKQQQPVKKPDECKCDVSEQKGNVKSTGKDLGTLISKTATEMSFSGETGSNAISSIYNKVFGSNPLLSYLAPSIENFQAKMVLPTNQSYLEIAKVYNGKNLDYRNVLETINPDGTKDYSAKDETGITFTWFEKWNTHKVVPPIWGVYTGISSPNNAKPVSLLDLFAFFHDIDYKLYGNFNETADYKLISRVYQNLDRFTPEEKQIALTTVKYFSTIGISARLYSGIKGDSILSPIDDVKNDQSFLPHVIETTPVDPTDYRELKKSFVDGIVEGIVQESHSSSPIAPIQNTPMSLRFLDLIDNLEISLE